MISIRLLSLGLAWLLLVAVPTQAQSPEATLAQMQNVPVVTLSEGDVTAWLAAARELKEKTIEIDNPLDGDSVPARQSMLGSLAANNAAMSVLKSHGFSAERFADVSLNIVLALGASEVDKHSEEIDAALAELEAMKDQLPPAQYEMLRTQVAGTRGLFARAPAGNIELVRKYEKELSSIE